MNFVYKVKHKIRSWLGGTCRNCGRPTFYDVDYCGSCR